MVLAVEDAISNTVLDFFGESKAVLTLKDEEDGTLPSAFDSRNYGFHIGQGAAFAVFESARAVESQGVTPHARLLGAYSASEVSSNAIGQRSDGEGFIKAITGAFGVSGVEAGQVRIVKTHGTGTASNNAAESAALAETLKDFVATSYKQKIGHTMGASGLLETLLLFNDMKGGIIPAIANRTDDDPVFLSRPVTVPDGLVLSLASGMGNIYSAAVWSKI
jgi:3-oxoacyl-[acyl-carrier-protein] synthase-1